MIDYYTPFYTNQYYHIYNRGNNGEKIFYSPANYTFFLKRFAHYFSDSAEALAYCLLPNHLNYSFLNNSSFEIFSWSLISLRILLSVPIFNGL